MAELVNYTPPPHMDAKALIQRAATQLRAWHAKYGEHQPGWLPPAGDVRWLEDADAYWAAHQWQQPAFVKPATSGAWSASGALDHPTEAKGKTVPDDALLALAKNFEITGPDADGLVWLVLHGHGMSGKGMFNLGTADRLPVRVALRLEEDRRAAIAAAEGQKP